MRQGVLDAEQPAPRLAEQVEVLEAEGDAHLLDLVDEAVEVPQRRVVGLRAVGAAELVVVDDLDAGLRQERVEALEVLVADARPAVQDEQRDVAAADPPGPDPLRPDRRRDRDPPGTARELVHARSLAGRAALLAEAEQSDDQPRRRAAIGLLRLVWSSVSRSRGA